MFSTKENKSWEPKESICTGLHRPRQEVGEVEYHCQLEKQPYSTLLENGKPDELDSESKGFNTVNPHEEFVFRMHEEINQANRSAGVGEIQAVPFLPLSGEQRNS